MKKVIEILSKIAPVIKANWNTSFNEKLSDYSKSERKHYGILFSRGN